jgi:hypothetical protein|tara:strand:- start:423 stop:821 length:399 start_codon:yes stop_codon:yes gene_type:complete
MNQDVAERFASYPANVRLKMQRLRRLIFAVAAQDERVGELTETLKWGELAYLTSASKSGTTVRIDWKAKTPNQYGFYVNCKTSLVDSYRSLFPELNFEGDRAVVFSVDADLPKNELGICIALALTYHIDKKR